jgi:hypothetical protein
VNERDEPLARTPERIEGGAAREDGFEFISDGARVDARDGMQYVLGRTLDGRVLRGWAIADDGTTWWSALAPDVPTKPGLAPLLLARRSSRSGRYLSVWSWTDAISSVAPTDVGVRVVRSDGARDVHSRDPAGWRIDRESAIGASSERIVVGGVQHVEKRGAESAKATQREQRPEVHRPPATFTLGEAHYRRSEESWVEAGCPGATVTVVSSRSDVLAVTVEVPNIHPRFVPIGAENPLDNEPAAINGDGVQLYIAVGALTGGWLLVPDPASHRVGVHAIEGWNGGLDVDARWEPTERGYTLTAAIALPRGATYVDLDVLVNEIGPDRERRRGQLVLSGARGEFVYLRGDRHDRSRLLRFAIADA